MATPKKRARGADRIDHERILADQQSTARFFISYNLAILAVLLLAVTINFFILPIGSAVIIAGLGIGWLRHTRKLPPSKRKHSEQGSSNAMLSRMRAKHKQHPTAENKPEVSKYAFEIRSKQDSVKPLPFSASLHALLTTPLPEPRAAAPETPVIVDNEPRPIA